MANTDADPQGDATSGWSDSDYGLSGGFLGSLLGGRQSRGMPGDDPSVRGGGWSGFSEGGFQGLGIGNPFSYGGAPYTGGIQYNDQPDIYRDPLVDAFGNFFGFAGGIGLNAFGLAVDPMMTANWGGKIARGLAGEYQSHAYDVDRANIDYGPTESIGGGYSPASYSPTQAALTGYSPYTALNFAPQFNGGVNNYPMTYADWFRRE